MMANTKSQNMTFKNILVDKLILDFNFYLYFKTYIRYSIKYLILKYVQVNVNKFIYTTLYL